MSGGDSAAVARGLNQRVANMAARRVARRKALLAQIYAEALPDAAVVDRERGIAITARRLTARLLADAALRWPARLLTRGRA